MGSNSKEMNIDLNIVYVPKLISDVLTEVSAMDDISKKLTKLNQFLVSLEEELRKIEAFKRELPFCMVLLKDAIERLKEEALQYKEKDKRPVMEEFIPLKKGNSDESGRVKKSNDLSDKKNWMSSAQLWSTPVQYESFDLENKGHFLHLKSSGVEEKDREKRYQLGVSKLKSDRGAFLPFQEQGLKEGKNGLAVKDLSLSMAVAVAVGEGEKGQNPIDASVKRDNGPSNSSGFLQDKSQQRKQRRCWSPELHRRFVDALHQLGGAQVATPKQIRDIMQVDGLTNDEVKSHLQKYRLHVRRVPISGCSWSNMDDSKTNGTQSGSPEGPLHFTGSGSAKGVSINEEEDNKSESYNWNGQLQKSIEAHV
ncbi:transcription factor HHO5-like isoform X2 [Solanum dulcamara]|uniref:transcription factor HHO5-like isoform X2 n=1 Tax=Solanum dulcamara TaxID=45834 RepID=UPI002486B091|nr:transcription factor HHO5-like isoform X2 [Solanum dulcamara]